MKHAFRCLPVLLALVLATPAFTQSRSNNDGSKPRSHSSSTSSSSLSQSMGGGTPYKQASISINLPMMALSNFMVQIELPFHDRVSLIIPLRVVYPKAIQTSIAYPYDGWLAGLGVGAKFYMSSDDRALDGGAYVGTHIAVMLGEDSSTQLAIAGEATAQLGYTFVLGPGIVVDPYFGFSLLTFFSGEPTGQPPSNPANSRLEGLNPLIGLNLGFAF